MPAFNAEQVLKAALDSVLAQTYSNFEIVLVDDGSTDTTREVAHSVSDNRVRYFRNPANLGGYQTMNKAVSLARGELVAIYHSDDIYEPSIVAKEVAYLRNNPEVGAVFCFDHFVDNHGTIFGGTSLPSEFRGRTSLSYEDIFPFFLRHQNILLRCPTFMARRAVFDVVGMFDAERYDIAADVEMWIRIARRFPIGILDERLMRYRVGASQWSSRYKRLRTEPDIFFAIMDRYLAEDGWPQRANRIDLLEYNFHRCDDETFRAANWILRGETAPAQDLLRRPFPLEALFTHLRRRKIRVLLLRIVMRTALALGIVRPVKKLLTWTEYHGQISL